MPELSEPGSRCSSKFSGRGPGCKIRGRPRLRTQKRTAGSNPAPSATESAVSSTWRKRNQKSPDWREFCMSEAQNALRRMIAAASGRRWPAFSPLGTVAVRFHERQWPLLLKPRVRKGSAAAKEVRLVPIRRQGSAQQPLSQPNKNVCRKGRRTGFASLCFDYAANRN